MKWVGNNDTAAAMNIAEIIRSVGSLPAGHPVIAAVHPAGWAQAAEWAENARKRTIEQRLLLTTGRDDAFVIVTRHKGAVEWLARRRYCGRVVEHATPDDVRGKAVIGVLPLHLAALCAAVASIDMPKLRADQRGVDLTPEEMNAAGATLHWYAIEKI